MNQLQPICQRGKRVLTTTQLAEAFGTEAKIINRNFQRNADRYVQGKHYFALFGEKLREFKGSRQFDDSLKFASILYLWTEKGAWLHAKSLNTEQAWDAYERLVDEYYSIKEDFIPLSKDQALVTVLRTTADLMEDTQTQKASL
jgi:ORF6N domain